MSSNAAAGQDEPTTAPTRIARYDEFFDPRKRAMVYRKTTNQHLNKHFEKLNKKKPVLVVRRQIDSRGRHSGTEVDIRSKKLCALLQDVCNGGLGLDISRNPPSCNHKLLYHAYDEVKAMYKKEKSSQDSDEELLDHLEVFMDLVCEDHAATYRGTQALLSLDYPSITFDLLWAIFRPGCLLYAYDEYTEQGRILKAQSYEVCSEGNQVYALVRSTIVAHDGRTFGTAVVGHRINQFDGTHKLQDLSIYPLQYHPDREDLRLHAIARGKKFLQLLQPSYVEASGSAVHEILSRDHRLQLVRFNVHGRVMIDPTAYRHQQTTTSSLLNLSVTYRLNPEKLTEEQLMTCTPIVLGFSFTSKQWGGFALDRLTDIEWSTRPFENLVLPNPKLKDMVHSMVKQHAKGTSNFDDVVKGKGKGLVGLLCGPPGCGKTLTAEAVAEVTRCPLYTLSAGQLGVEHEAVEERLTEVLELAQKWRAVVLLDEADVFLAQRDTTNIKRNALVSIFLRKLEYYQGILILTTNLITHCDVAFESRIHFTIHYPELSRPSRLQIWKNFIALADGKHNITDVQLEELSNFPLNGRQIKNSVSVAHSFAAGAEVMLSVDHIHTVLEVLRDWEKAKIGTKGPSETHQRGKPESLAVAFTDYLIACVLVVAAIYVLYMLADILIPIFVGR